ncbi:MAG: hypothetical protein H6557_09460 [Lewinellaceae bacterium]|nr:hypothetical protein [Phaeodactylibacter sp.]MCB9036832.1 hypothetical protein [Lewinellaceae bacterium]
MGRNASGGIERLTPPDTASAPELLLLNRLLIRKLGEVARVLDPEVYRDLGLGE